MPWVEHQSIEAGTVSIFMVNPNFAGLYSKVCFWQKAELYLDSLNRAPAIAARYPERASGEAVTNMASP